MLDSVIKALDCIKAETAWPPLFSRLNKCIALYENCILIKIQMLQCSQGPS